MSLKKWEKDQAVLKLLATPRLLLFCFVACGPQPKRAAVSLTFCSKREYSRLWRWVQVRPGMRREEQPRQRVRFTEGSLGAEAGGGLDARSPSLVLPPSRSLPGSITPLTAVIQAASLWSSPCLGSATVLSYLGRWRLCLSPRTQR